MYSTPARGEMDRLLLVPGSTLQTTCVLASLPTTTIVCLTYQYHEPEQQVLHGSSPMVLKVPQVPIPPSTATVETQKRGNDD